MITGNWRMKWIGRFSGLLLFCLVVSLGTLPAGSPLPGEKTLVEVPLKKLKEWRASLLASEKLLKQSEASVSSLKSTLEALRATSGQLRTQLSSLRLSLENSLLDIEKLKTSLLDSESNLTALQDVYQELQTTSVALSMELKAVRTHRLRDIIITAAAGVGAGLLTGIVVK